MRKRQVLLGDIIPDFCPALLTDLVAGHFAGGVLRIEGSVPRYYFERYRDAQREVDNKKTRIESEAAISLAVADSLRSSGWLVETEAYTSQGRIDILATRGDEVKIIEVKLKESSHDAAHALGQLLFYCKFHPGASLWFCSPRRPDETIISILDSYGVKYHEP